MRLLNSFQQRWTQWRDEERREEDERQRLARLLAYRDAFFALVVMLVGYLFVQAYVLGGVREGQSSGAYLTLFPLLALTLAGIVKSISWRARSGGVETRVAAIKAGRAAIGLALGYLIVALLSWTGILPMRGDLLHFLGASAIGICFAAVLVLVFYSRSGSPRD